MQTNEVNKESKGPFSSIYYFSLLLLQNTLQFVLFPSFIFFLWPLKKIFFNLEIIVDSQEVAKKYTGLCALSPVPLVLTSCVTVG